MSRKGRRDPAWLRQEKGRQLAERQKSRKEMLKRWASNKLRRCQGDSPSADTKKGPPKGPQVR